MAGNDPSLSSLGPLDGRYQPLTGALAQVFSERSLIHHRYLIEVDWLLCLCALLPPKPAINKAQLRKISSLKNDDPQKVAVAVKKIEKSTNHDLKAVELHLAARLEQIGLARAVPLVHLGCTSWDINNIAYALMLRKANDEVIVPRLRAVQARLEKLAVAHAKDAMLGRTHGQPASPTTFGKEMRIFAQRLGRQVDLLQCHVFAAKLNGAVGNYSAHRIASAKVDWQKASRDFVTGLNLGWESHTTQIGPYDTMVEYFDALARANRILLDLAADVSAYLALGYLRMRSRKKEVGSSTMPHKVNPINFENAEGNLSVANALLGLFAERLQVSRLQRDLSDSTVARNFGVALGHTTVALASMSRGLEKLQTDKAAMLSDLDRNWQVLAEAVQTALRVQGDAKAYEKLKQATRGLGALDEKGYRDLVEKTVPEGAVKKSLLGLRPENYLGEAVKLARSGRTGAATNRGKT